MDGGIHADQNFYSRPPNALSPERNPQRTHRSYDPPPLPDFDIQSPQVPPKLPFLTIQNLHAATSTNAPAGGYGSRRLSGELDPEPDDFYRDYRGVPSASNSFAENPPANMAATASESRPQPSLRSNGNGTTAKHPPLPPARTTSKPSFRSASSPLDNHTGLGSTKPATAVNAFPPGRQQSVKDLLRRFDPPGNASNEQPSSTPRKPVPRINTRDVSGPGYMKDRVGYQTSASNSSSPASVSKTGSFTRDNASVKKSTPQSRATQRTRYTPEDQHSVNARSTAARMANTHTTPTGSTPLASRSMSNLSPPSTEAPPLPQVRRPLFGEITPVGQGANNVGYGIPQTPVRRTSTSSLHTRRKRSKSDLDISPTTAWYLGVTPALDDVDINRPAQKSPAHSRSQSDFLPAAKINVTTVTVNGKSSFQQPHYSPVHPPVHSPVHQPTHSVSRIPLPRRGLSNSSDSSPSLPSTRGNSPPIVSRPPVTNPKMRAPDRRSWSPAARASVTPTNREKATTRSPPSRRKARSPEKPPSTSAPLKAYISSTPAKSSPPLRSSRPRLPVSSASTASSRQKVTERSGSPHAVKTGMRLTRNVEPKQRKIVDIPLGQVDFQARRERIKRAYTTTINETEQKTIRAANLKRLKEREQAKEAMVLPAANADEAPSSAVIKVDPPSMPNSPPHSPPPQNLHINTSFQKSKPNPNTIPVPHEIDQDSPTLGMPGKFIDDDDDDDEPPHSAISNATGITDIENEPQTEAGLSQAMSSKFLAPSRLSSHFTYLEDQLSPEQALFGMQYLGADSPVDVGDESIHIMLDTSSVEDSRAEPTPTNDAFDQRDVVQDAPVLEQLVPGAFQDDPEPEQPVFMATLISASPDEVTPVVSLDVALSTSEEASVGRREIAENAPDKTFSIQNQNNPEDNHEIAHPDEIDHLHTPDPAESSSFSLPKLRIALAPPITHSPEANDYLNTPVTDMDYDSSDGLAAPDARGQEHQQDEHDRFPEEPKRSSHVSSWTNDSIESNDDHYDVEDYSRSSIAVSDPEKKPTPPPKEVSPALPPKPDGYSPHPSPRYQSDVPLYSSPPRHQLPPLAIGDGFGLGLDRPAIYGAPDVPLWAPDYSPPPPPTPPPVDDSSAVLRSREPQSSSLYSKRPDSSLYQSSQNDLGQANESRRASDDFYSPRHSSSTPRSSTQISFDEATPDGTLKIPQPPAAEVFLTEEEKAAAKREEKRLYQRKMVIKELIDTESVYLKDMNVVEEIYKGTAEACPKLGVNDIKSIFRNTDEVVAFSTTFLDELKSAAASIYTPRSHKSRQNRAATNATTASSVSPTDDRLSIAPTLADETDDQKDRKTFIGANFGKHLPRMQVVYAEFLKNNEAANARLAILQKDPAVKVWLNECNHVAKDITQAWDIDALLVKPVQRVTRYQLLLSQITSNTPSDHPDYEALQTTVNDLSNILTGINEMKQRIHMVGKIVSRKRNQSDARSGIAKAFAKRTDKYQSSTRPQDDEAYVLAHEKFNDDYLRLQVVLRDFQFYTRQVDTYAHDWLRQLSSMELIMRMAATSYPEIESKWAHFNMGMRAMGSTVLDAHVASVQKKVIDPIENLISMYGPISVAMKKRGKRRLDFERYQGLVAGNKKIDEKLNDQVAQYHALNETLKLELPALSAKTQLLGNLVISQFVKIQVSWWDIWQQKVRVVLEDKQLAKDIPEIKEFFLRDFKYVDTRVHELGIVNGSFGTFDRSSTRDSQSTQDEELRQTKSRPSNLTNRSRGLSVTSDQSPSLPTPDFAKRHSGQFTFSPIVSNAPGLPQPAHQAQAFVNGHSRTASGGQATPESASSSRPYVSGSNRPSTSRSQGSDTGMRMSTDYNTSYRRESGSTYGSTARHVDGPPLSTRPYSGLFHSAMPMMDGAEESQRSSRASSRDRGTSEGFNILYLAASLFEFNIEATKKEAGYPYLTYQAGEIFDVIGEKGELWLAKNQDDPSNMVGWIWSKHFARLAM